MHTEPIHIAGMLCLAVALDWLMGDPRWFPHPVKAFAAIAIRLEIWTRRVFVRLSWAGGLTALAVYISAFLLGYGVVLLGFVLHPVLGMGFTVLSVATTIGARDLIIHARRVAEALGKDELKVARQRVSWMVGRDTQELDEQGVVRAAVESLAESTADGIISPLFFSVLGGLLMGFEGASGLAMFYRAANTLDSMFGYQNQRYRDFGKVSAKVDDVLNYLPARLSAGCIAWAAVFIRGRSARHAFRAWMRDARKHKSPNAGRPEAAMAGALGIQLGGPARYGGVLKAHACLGRAFSEATRLHIHQASGLVIAAELWFVVLACTVLTLADWVF